MPNIAAAMLADKVCVSVQEVSRRKTDTMLHTKCRAEENFVFVPPGVKGNALRDYLAQSTPSNQALKDCNLTKQEWLARAVLEHSRR